MVENDKAGAKGRWGGRGALPWVALLALLALALRLYRLAGPVVLRWDEGWSVAHASLPWGELWRVATEEWHPPAYVALLKLWLAAGKGAWSVRFLSVLLGVAAVPLSYAAGKAWSGRRRVALIAAGLVAVWPLLVYYGQVARMYALSALAVLAATWFMLRITGPSEAQRDAEGTPKERWPSRSGPLPPCGSLGLLKPGGQHFARCSLRDDLGLVLSSTLALYTLYHTAWVLAGLWLYAAILWPRRLRRLIVLGLAVLVGYAPWLLAALTTIEQRAGMGATAGGHPILRTLSLLKPALEGLAFVYGAAPWAAPALAAVLAGGLAAGWLGGRQTPFGVGPESGRAKRPAVLKSSADTGRRSGSPPAASEAKKLLLPLFVLAFSVVGIAYSSGVYWFAVRHLVPASVFLCLALAWALDRLWALWRPLLPIALVALAVAYWPTSTRFIYEKTLEVVDPFDPTEDYRYLAGKAGPGDLVYFNVLARAGWYESLRGPSDARWSYAMRWDPIIEPMERIAARIQEASGAHRRLWFVLYKGNYGPNADLVAWLNAHLYPAGGEWQKDMLYLAFVAPAGGWASAPRDDLFEGGIRLTGARWTPEARQGDAAALELTWTADAPVAGSYKVFVHAADDTGRVVAQHDGVPAAGERPTDSWAPGEAITDRHGLFLPAGWSGVLHIWVGLYEPGSGVRLRLTDGSEVDLCTIAVK